MASHGLERLRAVVCAARSGKMICSLRTFHSSPLTRQSASSSELPAEIQKLLSTPSWSVSSLLTPRSRSTASQSPEITPKQLHHLLRLSALPQPASPAEEEAMLATLSAQLNFVRDIQSVDTTGVEPLRGLHDETAQGRQEAELNMDSPEIKEALAREVVVGKFHKRLRRKRAPEEDVKKDGEVEAWDVLETASRKTGRYFVVEREQKQT